MCYPGMPSVSFRDLAVHQRLFVLQAPMVVETVTRHASTTAAGEGEGSGGGGGGSIKQCVCSPTRHPGSFRCRQHHSGYAWGGRMLRDDGSSN
ncbi:Ly-6/neurotoxin protein [Fagus crenata]